MFYIIDRQTAPSGNRTATVYSHDITETFLTDTGMIFKHSGKSRGRTLYEEFLILNSYNKNSSSNLSLYINMNLSPREKFSELMTKEHWDTLEFE